MYAYVMTDITEAYLEQVKQRAKLQFAKCNIEDVVQFEKDVMFQLEKEYCRYIRYRSLNLECMSEDTHNRIKSQLLGAIQDGFAAITGEVKLNDKTVEALTQQVKDAYHRAFWDLLIDDLKQDPIKTDHILKLLDEVRERINKLFPKHCRAKYQAQNEEYIDTKYLKQLFDHKLFDADMLAGTFSFIIEDRLMKLIAPCHDKDIKEWYHDIMSEMKTYPPFHDIVPKIFQGIYKYLEIIETEVHEFHTNILKRFPTL